MNRKEQIIKTLIPLFDDYKREMIPANEKSLQIFRQQLEERAIPNSTIEQLIGFYEVTDGVPCLDGLTIYNCDDETIFEWWDSNNVLWIGGHDDDVFRWANNKFCIGDASDISYDKENEFQTFIELLTKDFERKL